MACTFYRAEQGTYLVRGTWAMESQTLRTTLGETNVDVTLGIDRAPAEFCLPVRKQRFGPDFQVKARPALNASRPSHLSCKHTQNGTVNHLRPGSRCRMQLLLKSDRPVTVNGKVHAYPLPASERQEIMRQLPERLRALAVDGSSPPFGDRRICFESSPNHTPTTPFGDIDLLAVCIPLPPDIHGVLCNRLCGIVPIRRAQQPSPTPVMHVWLRVLAVLFPRHGELHNVFWPACS